MKTRAEPLDAVLTHVMQDLHDAEMHLRSVLPVLWEKAEDKALAEALRQSLHESNRHMALLTGMLESLGSTPSGRPWQGMRAVIAETLGAAAAGIEPSHMTDLLLVSGCMRIKALKVAAYGTARSMAEKRGDQAMAYLLQDILTAEMEGDLKLVEFTHAVLVSGGLAQA